MRVHTPQPQFASLGRVDELERVAPEAGGELRAASVRLLRDLHHDRVADREPAAGRKTLLVETHVDKQVVARERPALRVGDEPEHPRRRDRELVVAVRAPLPVYACRPAVAHEALLDRQLGRVGRLAFTLARTGHDQLQRPVLGAERAKLGKPLVEPLAGRVEIRAHGPRCYRPSQRPESTSKSALSFAASSGSSRGDDLLLVSAALLTTRACTPRS